MSDVTAASAPGKLFLLGEYSVLYGGPAIVLAVERRITVRLENAEAGILVEAQGHKMRMRESSVPTVESVDPFFRSVTSALRVFEETYGSVPPLRVKTDSEIPFKGLGSSSASIVATLGALHLHSHGSLNREKIYSQAYEAKMLSEDVGSPSDIAASVFGGVQMVHNSGVDPCPNIEEGIVACYSGIPSATEDMYGLVSSLRRRQPDVFEMLMGVQEAVTSQALGALRRRDYQSLGSLMNVSHGIQESLGVGHAELCRIVFEALDAGAMGAKLSGAGGGDCAVVLIERSGLPRILTRLSALGKDAFEVETATEGVREEVDIR